MPKTPHRAAALAGTADDVEAAFYESLQRGDVEALMACWSDEDEVFCVHPGGPRLVGTVAIRAAFEQMFGNCAIHATPAHVRKVESLASAVPVIEPVPTVIFWFTTAVVPTGTNVVAAETRLPLLTSSTVLATNSSFG